MQSLSTELRAFQVGELAPHPWQKNVPDIQGKEWSELLADIRKRGIVEPIRVSTRLGYPVIVDGHQRHRAATELGLELIDAHVQKFGAEAEEVEFLAAAARLRRHLTDAQKVTLGRAYEAYFKPRAEDRQRAGAALASSDAKGDVPPALGEDPETLRPIGRKVENRTERTTTAQAAAAVGLSDSTYKRGKAVQDRAPSPVRQAWEREEISTNAAHQLTKAPDPIQEALEREEIDVHQALRVEKDKTLRREVETGQKTVQEAVSLADQMKAAMEREDAEMGTKAAHSMASLMQKMLDVDVSDYLEVLNSRHNHERWNGSFSSDWQDVIRHMRAIAQAAEGRAAEQQKRTITVEALN